MEHIKGPIEQVLLKIIAARIIADLDNFDNQCTVVDKIAHSHTEARIAVVIRTLKELQETGKDADDSRPNGRQES